MTFRHPDPPRPPASPRPLLVALAALLASEIFHIAATLQNHSEPQAPHPFGPAAHVASAVLTAALMVWVGRRGPLAAPLTALAGGSVAVAAIDSASTVASWAYGLSGSGRTAHHSQAGRPRPVISARRRRR